MRIIKKYLHFFGLGLLLVCLTANISVAQTTEFTYQGKLSDSGMPSATYDFEFRLCDSPTDCSLPLEMQQIAGVPVSNGVFTVQLNFTATSFDGSDRWLEIAVKRPAQGTYITLLPRQPVTSAPYSIRSLNTANADNTTLFGGLTTGDFIQNRTTQQTGSFNISGDGIIAGNVGIGGTPQTGIRLDVTGNSVFRTPNGNVNFGSPNGETGMSIIGTTNRGDVRFDGATLRLLAGAGIGPPSSTNGISINSSGNVGIGTLFSPTSRLEVAGNTYTSGNLNVGAAAGIVGGMSVGGNLGVGNGIFVSNGLIVNSGNLSVTNGATIGGGATVSNGLTVNSGNLNVTQAGASLNVTSGITLGFVPNGGTIQLCHNPSTKSIANCSASSLRYKRDVENFDGGLRIVNRLRPIRFNWKENGRNDIGFAAEEVNEIEPLLAYRNERGEIDGVKYQLIGVVLAQAVKEQQTQIEQQNRQIKQQQTTLETQQKQIDDLQKIVCALQPQAGICR